MLTQKGIERFNESRFKSRKVKGRATSSENRKFFIYKICIIVYKCLHNSAPADSDIPLLLHLASNKCTRLKVTFNRRKVSDGAFSIYAPKLWNSLPDRLIQLDDFSVFRCDLKTYLFSQYFLSH